MTANVSSGFLDHRGLQVDPPEAGHRGVDVVAVHRLLEQPNAFDLGPDLDGTTAAAGDLQTLHDCHRIAVGEQIADGITDNLAFGRRRLIITVRSGRPFVAAHRAHEKRALFVGVRLLAFRARRQLIRH